MTLLELKKLMMKAKKEDKVKANALMMLVDTIQKLQKEDGNKKEEIEYIKQGVKKYLKLLEDSEKNGINIEEEKKVIQSIAKKVLPKELTKEELEKIVEKMIEENGKKPMGFFMGELKKRFGERVNMKLASQIVNEKLKK
jgi:uncharacterized protein YqeY